MPQAGVLTNKKVLAVGKEILNKKPHILQEERTVGLFETKTGVSLFCVFFLLVLCRVIRFFSHSKSDYILGQIKANRNL